MTDYEMSNEYIRELLNRLISVYKHKWDNDNTVSFKKGKTVTIGTLVLNNNKVSSGDELLLKEIKQFKALVDKAEKLKPTPDSIKETVFKDIFNKPQSYGGLSDSGIMLGILDKAFSSVSINRVEIEKSYKLADTVSTDGILLSFNGRGEGGRSITSGINDKIRTKYKDFEIVKRSNFSLPSYLIPGFVDDKPTEINIGDVLIGYYHSTRNFIEMFPNLFMLKKFEPLDNVIPEHFAELIAAIKAVKPKLVDVSALNEKIFIESYLSSLKQKMSSIENDIKSYHKSIKDYDRSVQTAYVNLHAKMSEKTYIEKALETNMGTLSAEISGLRSMKYLKNVKLKNGSLELHFIPTTIKIPNYIRHDHGKEFGARTTWLGELVVKLFGDHIEIKGDSTMINGSYPHPHANGQNGNPCLGSGEPREKIYSLLAQQKFVEVSKMFWFWVKNYESQGAYVPVWNWYDDRLKQGLPVWDEKGNKIEINDPVRIKTGEQIKLDKADNYDKNIKKYADIKI